MKTARDLKIHLYALCWNEEKMLPHFFRYYDEIVDQYFISDNHSTDDSVKILSAHPKVTLSEFDVTGDSFIECARQHYNQCWKASRGQADWVIVCNIDEHMYHRNLRRYLRQCTRSGTTLHVSHGYNMVSETFPASDTPLHRVVPRGMREPHFDKPQVFNPNAIDEINFVTGRHSAEPTGNVVIARGKLKLLHFKYLGLDYLLPRLEKLGTGLKTADLETGWFEIYTGDAQFKRAAFQNIQRHSVRVLAVSGQISVWLAWVWGSPQSVWLRRGFKSITLFDFLYQKLKTVRTKE